LIRRGRGSGPSGLAIRLQPWKLFRLSTVCTSYNVHGPPLSTLGLTALTPDDGGFPQFMRTMLLAPPLSLPPLPSYIRRFQPAVRTPLVVLPRLIRPRWCVQPASFASMDSFFPVPCHSSSPRDGGFGVSFKPCCLFETFTPWSRRTGLQFGLRCGYGQLEDPLIIA